MYFKQFFNATDETFSGLTALTTSVLQVASTFLTLLLPSLLSLGWIVLSYYSSDLTDISFLKQTPSLFRLKYLSFYDNRITSIQSNTLSNYTNLYNINLSSNKISRLENGCFNGLRSVRYLHLHSNQFRKLSKTGIQRFSLFRAVWI